MSPYKLEQGNSKDLLKTLVDNSIDAIVTDPPYELGFMGKKWDASGIAYDVDLWRECLRVLKPGGHLLAFSGSRTYHRMTVAIEDAGFDIRDQIMWLYGSGFPKSHNISKAIHKLDAKELQKQRQCKFTAWVRSQNVTSSQIDKATGTYMGSHYTTEASQPAIMTREHLEACRHLFTDIPKWVEMECDLRSVGSENFKSREILREQKRTAGDGNVPIAACSHNKNGGWFNITAPATDAAKEWDGWGTALKPAHEPICVARKPLIGTVAENVLKHGTGAINVDACRVGNRENEQFTSGKNGTVNAYGNYFYPKSETPLPNGRWPANIIHDGSAEVLAGFPSDEKQSPARFFYCAKASKRDRDEGLEGFEEREARSTNWSGDGMPLRQDGTERKQPIARNHHPTVKPTNLMQYLCRLVTPPNGVILDPFLGSGSTGKAAIYEGFQFVGFDLSAEYVEISRARIEYAMQKRNETSKQNENTLYED
jgi:DNA modification methylase